MNDSCPPSPEGFRTPPVEGPVAVIAGRDDYPARTIGQARSAGVELRLIALEGETRPEVEECFPPEHRTRIKVGQVGRMLKALKRFGVRQALMVGQVSPRRLFKGLHPDIRAIRLLASLKRRNAETIFGAIAEAMAAEGVELLDARCFLDDDLAPPGAITDARWEVAEEYLRHGIELATECARLDIGQGVVVRQGTVIAVEAYEGTDAMLKRAGEFNTRGMCFVKTVKPRQDYRFDVPLVGLKTLDSLEAAGIRHVAVKAGSVILLDRPRLVKAAEKMGIAIRGF